MRQLVIDTATPWLSVALFDDEQCIGHDHRQIGRGHAEQLLPAIAALPGGGRADVIRVGCGPGSFTGLRIGVAAARALAFGWNAALSGYDTMALIAAHARMQAGADLPPDAPIAVVMDGGHGEVFVEEVPLAARSLTMEDAAEQVQAHYVAGPRAQDLVALRGWGVAIDGQADVRAIAGLHARAILADVQPLYGRAPDAKPSAAGAGAVEQAS
jgi:tRNA threonylcarbamoyl adenosine modification protein YeaZ